MFNKLRYAAVLSLFFLLQNNFSFSQSGCPGCAIDVTCTANQDVSICPPALPDACFNAPYSEDLTFYVPKSLVYQGQNVTLGSIQLLSITNIPPGLTWELDNPSGNYTVTAPEIRGCIKICGTPTAFGTFFVTVTVNANVTSPINTTQTQSFSLPLIVTNCGGGNPFFSYDKNLGCDSLNVKYEATFPIPSEKVVEYEWNFDNGQTSTLKKPAPVNYAVPDTYLVELQTKLYNLSVDSITANVTGEWWCGDIIGEQRLFGICTGSPDLVVTIVNSGQIVNGPEKSNTFSTKWGANELRLNGQPFILKSPVLSISFIDVDPSPDPDDNGGSDAVLINNGVGIYSYQTVSPDGGGVTGNIYVGKKLDTIYTQIDTIIVHPLPPATSILALPDTTVCGQDTIFLSVYDGPYRYVWFNNDTSVIPFENANTYFVPGNKFSFIDTVTVLRVQISDTITGCIYNTENIIVTQLTPIPLYLGSTGIYKINSTTLLAESGYSYQWLFNGLPIAGATNKEYKPLIDGQYSCIFTNASGCSDTSNVINFVISSINDLNSFSNLVSLFPNPSNGIMTLYVASSESTELSFDVYSNVGQLIASEKLERAGNSFSKQLDYSTFQAGNYVMHLSMNGQSASKRFIIIK